MPTLSGRQILSVAGTSYVWEDVVLAGVLWGDWETLEGEVRSSLACLKRLEQGEEAEEILSEQEIDEVAAEFRYARDLVAAEDMEAWLERHDLGADDWMDWVQRSLLVKKWADELEEIQQACPVSREEVGEVILSDALCGERAAAWAATLAARAAVHARMLTGEPDGQATIPEGKLATVLQAVRTRLEACDLPEHFAELVPSRLPSFARLEIDWRRFAAALVTPEAVARQVAAHRLDWTRVTVRSLVFSDPDAAREAMLCIREDHLDPAEVAAEAGVEVEEGGWFLEDVEGSLRDCLAGAQAGEVIGPLKQDGAFLLVAVIAKRIPSVEDPAVRARAERTLLGQAVAREVEERVQWHEPLA